MPGINYIAAGTIQDEELARAMAEMKHTEHIEVGTVYRDEKSALLFSEYDGYPSLRKETDRFLVILEGMIYNRTDDDIVADLEAIAGLFLANAPTGDAVRRFMDASDGDFLVAILDKSSRAALFYNDIYGRFPVLYYDTGGTVIVTREPVFMYRFAPVLEIDRIGIAQFIMYEITLGARTFFKDVNRYPTGHSMKVRYDRDTDSFRAEHEQIQVVRFDKEPIHTPRSDLVERQYQLFLRNTRTRYETCVRKGYHVVGNISGGLDSRGSLMGMWAVGARAEFYTMNLYTEDESGLAKEVTDQFGFPLRTVPASRHIDLDEVADRVYRTGCMVNGLTTLVCWRDAEQKRQLCGSRAASFEGLFGEISRVFSFPSFGNDSIYSMFLTQSMRMRVCPDSAAILSGISPAALQAAMKEHFHSYGENTVAGQVQHYLFELFRNYGEAGEDRSRIFFWTVQPMGGKEMYRFVMEEQPVRFNNNAFYLDFLRRIDPRGLKIPYHGSKMRLTSPLSVWKNTLKGKARFLLKSALMRFRPSRNFIFYLERTRRKDPSREMYVQKIFETIDSLTVLKPCIRPDSIRRFMNIDADPSDLFRVLTILLFFRELETRFGGKLSCPEPVV